jgi:hypothetical protein
LGTSRPDRGSDLVFDELLLHAKDGSGSERLGLGQLRADLSLDEDCQFGHLNPSAERRELIGLRIGHFSDAFR